MNLKINDRIKVRDIKFFNKFNVTLDFDAVASNFTFDFYFDPLNREHAEMSCVSHFHECIVQHNGKDLITGFIINPVFKSSAKKQLTSFSGYSKPGVLEDCSIPPSLYPLQTNGLTVKQIAERLCAPFKLKVVVEASASADMNKAIPKSTASETETIKEYLTKLCTSRQIIMTHDAHGDLLFKKVVKKDPIAHFEKNAPGIQFTMSYNGQGMHSHITVIKEASMVVDDLDKQTQNAGEYTIKNPLVQIVYRPKVIKQSTGDDITTSQVAKNALAAELKNIGLSIEIDRWDLNNDLILPDSFITVTDPELFLYKKTKWFIRSVNYSKDPKKTTATLTCVLPACFDGSTPENIFVDPHKNLPTFEFQK